MLDITLLENIIIGRVEPHIYAFATNSIPNYLKIGDTYRPVNDRLKEWREFFPLIEKKFEVSAKLNNEVYFRDYAVHHYIENFKHRSRLLPNDISSEIYYSKEFFKNATVEDIIEAINDINTNFNDKTQKYQFYNAVNRLAEKITFDRIETYSLRPNQEETVRKFKIAIENNRTNLLMYAVMRFGKSFTAMSCAVEMDANLVVVVSAKADVKIEWKRTVESHANFAKYVFLTSEDLNENINIIKDNLNDEKKTVVFLTLQDLQGETIKDKHIQLFGKQIDLLLIDETHFGARSEKYGQVLKVENYEKDIINKVDKEDIIDIDEAEKHIKILNARVRIHLSGTPYRILMGSEFENEDIIAFYQFTDIVKEQQKWIVENTTKLEEHQQDDWANPYYGFPQMIRFAFKPNESSVRRLEELRASGVSYAFSALLKPKSITKVVSGDHKIFINEQEILDLLNVIDGSKNDNEVLSFLDYDRIQQGEMCHHIVIVLPYCASCDALETLINKNKDMFKNLSSYEIVNISGIDNPKKYKSTFEIKKIISSFEKEGKKTITLTVNRMLTGSTVPEWDTMIYLKDTSSPQEYDQAIFRLQNQFIKVYESEDGQVMKYNMKPQTLLVDFLPNRMFIMQEQKAQVYNVNIDDGGNHRLRERIEEELKISPIITINQSKITEVKPTDILEVVSNYKMDKGIKDEALEIPVDLGVLNILEFKTVIENENEIGSKSGISISTHQAIDDEDEGSNLDIPPVEGIGTEGNENRDNGQRNASTSIEQKYRIRFTKKIQSYYTRILLFGYITKDRVASLKDILDIINNANNKRVARNLGLHKNTLDILYDFYLNHNKWALRGLDYKIQDLSKLSHADLSPEQKAKIAVNKFGKLGDAIVITPSYICDEIVSLLHNEIFESNQRILDIASVSGEFAIAIVKKLRSFSCESNTIKDTIYSIPKSPICYELTRKVYELLDLKVSNIATFYSEDMIKIKRNNDVDYERIKRIILQNKVFSEIKLNDNIEEVMDMIKFDVIVGNPPYQENIGKEESNRSLGKQLFPHFIKSSINISSRYVSLITPSKWFTGNGQDNSFPSLREFIKANNHFSRFVNYLNGKEVFDEVDTGSINYFLYDAEYCNETLIFEEKINNAKISIERKLFEDDMDIIIPMNNMISVLNKVKNLNFSSIDSIVSGRNPFGIPANNRDLDAASSIIQDDYYDTRIVCAYEEIKYINHEEIKRNEELKDRYKVLTSKINGGAGTLLDGRPSFILGKTYVSGLNEICSNTLLTIGSFDNIEEASNLNSYMKTKFFRFMLGIKKVANVLTSNVYSFVPNQNFTATSDIDWEKSVLNLDPVANGRYNSETINEIDAQLYMKYGLSKEEVQFIEKMIRPMI